METMIPTISDIVNFYNVETIEQIASETGFTKRKSRFGGLEFLGIMTLGLFAEPDVSLNRMAKEITPGMEISAPGLHQRINKSAVAWERWRWFTIRDETSTGYKHGGYVHISITGGVTPDHKYVKTSVKLLEEGDLAIFDLGYSSKGAMFDIAECGAYFLCRLNCQLELHREVSEGELEKFDLLEELKKRSVFYNKMGDMLQALGRGEEALEYYQRSMDIRKHLAELEPDRADRQLDLVASLVRVAGLDPSHRKEYLSRAEKILEDLDREGRLPPSHADWLDIVRKLISQQ